MKNSRLHFTLWLFFLLKSVTSVSGLARSIFILKSFFCCAVVTFAGYCISQPVICPGCLCVATVDVSVDMFISCCCSTVSSQCSIIMEGFN